MGRVYNQNTSNSRVVQITKLFQSFTLYLQIKSLSIRDCVRDRSGNPFGFFFKNQKIGTDSQTAFSACTPKKRHTLL